MNIQLSAPQMEFFNSTAKSVAAVAGFGSGKTQVGMTRLFATMFKNPGCNFLYLAPTFPLIRDIFYPKVEEFLTDLGLKFFINKTENTITVPELNSKIFSRTMENPSRIIGFETLDAFLDELDILPQEKAMDVWRKAKARCRQKAVEPGKKNQMYVTTTPEGFKATYQLFKKDPLPNSHLIQMSTYSNAHNLPDDYIEDLRDNYPSQLIEAYIEGEFVNLTSGAVWTGYHREKNRSPDTYIRGEDLVVGMDFNVGRGCAIIYVTRYYGKVAVGEIVDSYDTPDTIRVLQEKYPDSKITVIPDASGDTRKSVNATTSDIALLRKSKFKVLNNNKNPNIKARVMSMNRMLCDANEVRRLYVNDTECPHFAEGLEQQVYDKNGLPEKGFGKMDDITDSGSYPIAYYHPIKQRNTKIVPTVGT